MTFVRYVWKRKRENIMQIHHEIMTSGIMNISQQRLWKRKIWVRSILS